MASAVSGMLSNTADTKPRPSAVCHEATGSFSTGIIEAHTHQREQEDAALERTGQQAPGRVRTGAVTRMATHTACR
jgi:hypothetical protein